MVSNEVAASKWNDIPRLSPEQQNWLEYRDAFANCRDDGDRSIKVVYNDVEDCKDSQGIYSVLTIKVESRPKQPEFKVGDGFEGDAKMQNPSGLYMLIAHDFGNVWRVADITTGKCEVAHVGECRPIPNAELLKLAAERAEETPNATN